ncbi:MAG TPA: type IV conjugative transfer system coupling protein TraD [Gammaproteobacteria bacterium]|jgi:type IV conjugative transfer system coupling protein TraD|nr:type IV conjugative transfer system coupling protein TraD [Gammaproteobacteria bacterium]
MQQENSLKNYTRGGQVLLHNIRMFMQITHKMAIIFVVIFLLITCVIGWITTSSYERYVSSQYAWSTVVPLLNEQSSTHFVQPNGVTTKVRYKEINDSALIKLINQRVLVKMIYAMSIGAAISFGMVLFIYFWLKKKGKKHTDDQLIKGDRVCSKEMARNLILQNKIQSDLSLGGLPLIKNKETAHLLFHGTTGSGKSNAIKELLDQIKQRGDRAIIYDKNCNYLEEFYDHDNDVLLNPLDVRGKRTNIWLDCRDSADFDNHAAAQIPMPLSTQDPFWVNAARTIFSTAAYEMRNDPNRHELKLLRYLLTADLNVLQHYLKGTAAETLVSEKTEKTAISIKAVLATYLKSMKYIKVDGEPFSIREWIRDEAANNWLFITSRGDRHEALKPLISAWLDSCVNSLLSLPANEERRIWIILDELTSLQQIPYLTAMLSESRKSGGCAVLGIQSYAQAEKVYGSSGAKEISGSLNTRVMFRQPDPAIAKWSADNFGETIVEEVREGISYGASSLRDGISINRAETRKPVVSYSEIMSLGDLHAYVRLPGHFPVVSVDFTYKRREKRNPGFILRNIDENNMKEIDQLIEKYENTPLINATQDSLSEKRRNIQSAVEGQALDI